MYKNMAATPPGRVTGDHMTDIKATCFPAKISSKQSATQPFHRDIEDQDSLKQLV